MEYPFPKRTLGPTNAPGKAEMWFAKSSAQNNFRKRTKKGVSGRAERGSNFFVLAGKFLAVSFVQKNF